VIIEDPSNIQNVFKERNTKRAIFPLFTIEMLKTQNDESFIYSTAPINFVNMVISLFEKALDEISKIPDLEPKIL
jgi:dynein heavy chain